MVHRKSILFVIPDLILDPDSRPSCWQELKKHPLSTLVYAKLHPEWQWSRIGSSKTIISVKINHSMRNSS